MSKSEIATVPHLGKPHFLGHDFTGQTHSRDHGEVPTGQHPPPKGNALGQPYISQLAERLPLVILAVVHVEKITRVVPSVYLTALVSLQSHSAMSETVQGASLRTDSRGHGPSWPTLNSAVQT